MSRQIVKFDRRPAHYRLEVKHACDLLHAGIVRVLERTRWHDHAGSFFVDRAFSSSEALYEASVQLSPQPKSKYRKPPEFSIFFRLARVAERCGRAVRRTFGPRLLIMLKDLEEPPSLVLNRSHSSSGASAAERVPPTWRRRCTYACCG